MRFLYDPLTNAHALAFGRIIAAWNSLENVIDCAIEAHLDLPMQFDGLVTALLEYPKKRDLFRVLAEASGSDKLFAPHVIEIERLNKTRNKVAHGVWVEGRKPGSIKPAGVKARGKIQVLGNEHNEEEWDADKLNRATRDMVVEAEALENLLRDLGLDGHLT